VPLHSTRRAVGALLATCVGLAAVLVVVAPAPQAGAASAAVPNGCLYSIDGYNRNMDVRLRGESSASVTGPGEVVTLTGSTVSADLPVWIGEYSYRLGLLGLGANTVSAKVWVAIEGTNTVEGTQWVQVDVTAATTISPSPSDPEAVVATPLSITDATLPDTTWTATGGAVTFRQGSPGSLAGIPAGTDGSAISPLGSLYVTTRLGFVDVSLDCRPGTVDIVNEPYPFTPASSWDAFEVVAGRTEVPVTCADLPLTTGWTTTAEPDRVVLGDGPVRLTATELSLALPGEAFRPGVPPPC
jgi:hypothetical protein